MSLGLPVQLLRERPECNGVSRLSPISPPRLLPKHPEPGPLSSTRVTRLPRYYGPLRLPPRPARPRARLRVSDSLSSMGLPCCDVFCPYVPPPLPRRVTRSLGGCPRSGYDGLPRVRVGSALATALSGPAQGSLALRPAGLLALLSRAVVRVARRPPVTRRPPTRSYEAEPPTASAGLSPARTRHLCTAHSNVFAFLLRRLGADPRP
jgi:hypothetical protein